jgi:hypothetical protein
MNRLLLNIPFPERTGAKYELLHLLSQDFAEGFAFCDLLSLARASHEVLEKKYGEK